MRNPNWGQYISYGFHTRKTENRISPANVTFTTEKLIELYSRRDDLKQMFPKEEDFLNYYKLAK